MTREVQAHARQLLVHSRYQAETLRLERPQGAAPTEVVPYGIPALPPSTNGHHAGEGPLLVAIGAASMRPKVVEAFGQLASLPPGARLMILGRATADEGAALMEMAERLGVGGRVGLVGPLSGRDHWEALRAADLTVQLREDADGGSASGPVCDAIAARVPTIVSGAGWQRELPDRVVLPVATDCSAQELAERIAAALDDGALRDEIRTAQDAFADENSFARVAERYAELLSLG
jgi:glycosyltransferase involved in cell wall biosynthesis